VFSSRSWANPGFVRRSAEFRVPSKLRQRVNFWIQIFTKYGKDQIVVHHRDYPHAVFKVVDFSLEARALSAVKLERFKKSRMKVHIKEVKGALKSLSLGREPRTVLERHIAQQLSFLPGKIQKYKKILKENLVRSQTGIKEKFKLSLQRSGRYMHIIEDIFVRQFGLPVELTRLPFIESSFDYRAYSSVGAAGIWQFMPRTGRVYGMKITYSVDERRDIVKSTKGAAKYLSSSYKQLGNWPLAITSYNHGVVGVKRRIKKIGTKDIVKIIEHPTTRVLGFASNNFYPEFLAALDVYDQYHSFFPGLRIEPPRYFVSYPLPHSLAAATVAKRLGTDLSFLQEYNYALSSRVWSGRYRMPKGYVLKLPKHYSSKLAVLKKSEPVGPTASSVYGGIGYRVRRGDTLSGIARKYGTSVSTLKKLNQLASDRVYVGQMLTVRAKKGLSSTTAKASGGYPSNPNSYRVRSGDSLYKIGRKYGLAVSELMALNKLKSSKIHSGQVLKLKKTAAAATQSGKYKVRRGDSLWSISKDFGVSINALKKANRMRTSKLKAGQTIVIP